jgi:hypothetical protein
MDSMETLGCWMQKKRNDIQVGAAAGVNDPGDIPWRTTVGPMGDALGDANEGEGGPEGGISVDENREAGGSVALRRSGNGKIGRNKAPVLNDLLVKNRVSVAETE